MHLVTKPVQEDDAEWVWEHISFLGQHAGLKAQVQRELVDSLSSHHQHPSDFSGCRICGWLLPGCHNQQVIL